MRILRRVAILVAVVVVVLVLVTQWIFPVVLSIDVARKPPILSELIPSELPDHSLSPATGTKVSYFGYEFQVPWPDLDGSKTKVYRNMVVLTFHSGLKMMFGVSPPKLWLDGIFPKTSKVTEAQIERSFNVHSDYDFVKAMYTFTPARMHLWSLSPRVHYREIFLLTIKSLAVQNEAQTGFFYVENPTFSGFQQGNPQSWPSNYSHKSRATISVQMFSQDGSLNLTIFQENFKNPDGVSQADINRIIQSMHKSNGIDSTKPDHSSPIP